MTKRTTTQKKASITKQRAINFLPNIKELKEFYDWESLARNLYEVLSDEALNPGNKIREKINKLIPKAEPKTRITRKPKTVNGSIKHSWAAYCIGLKNGLKLPTNIAAAREGVRRMKASKNIQVTEEEEIALIMNISKRISELRKKIRK